VRHTCQVFRCEATGFSAHVASEFNERATAIQITNNTTDRLQLSTRLVLDPAWKSNGRLQQKITLAPLETKLTTLPLQLTAYARTISSTPSSWTSGTNNTPRRLRMISMPALPTLRPHFPHSTAHGKDEPHQPDAHQPVEANRRLLFATSPGKASRIFPQRFPRCTTITISTSAPRLLTTVSSHIGIFRG